MNIVILLGRLVRDPEPQGEGEIKRVKFSLAVDKKEGADFINCVVFGKQAENVLKYCKKGTQVSVEGSLNTYKYENEEGQTISGMNVTARIVKFLGQPNSKEEQTNHSQSKETNSNKPYEEFARDMELPFE